MKARVSIGTLLLINCALVFLLVLQLTRVRHTPLPAPMLVDEAAAPAPPKPIIVSRPKPRETAFAAIYSPNPMQLALNLRQIGCPEETVKDILRAEVNRKFAAQEKSLRPLPQDHVPWSWSAKTSEARLIERRQAAAAIARQKSSILRDALGYEVAVKMPAYAATMTDWYFDRSIDGFPAGTRATAQRIHENYWERVQELRNRTKGFYLPEEADELKELQASRKSDLEGLGIRVYK